MAFVNVNEVKTHFSKYLQLVEKGDTVTICKRNVPIAEIKAITRHNHKRKLGFAEGQGKIPLSFFDPLIHAV